MSSRAASASAGDRKPIGSFSPSIAQTPTLHVRLRSPSADLCRGLLRLPDRNRTRLSRQDPITAYVAPGQQEPLTVFSSLRQHLRYRPSPGRTTHPNAIGLIPTVTLQRSRFSKRANNGSPPARMIRPRVLFVSAICHASIGSLLRCNRIGKPRAMNGRSWPVIAHHQATRPLSYV